MEVPDGAQRRRKYFLCRLLLLVVGCPPWGWVMVFVVFVVHTQVRHDLFQNL
jgi:hypothetical protein